MKRIIRKRVGNRKYLALISGGQYHFQEFKGLKTAIKPPLYLYKYYSLSKNSKEAIIKHYLYASAPKELNDRFDCSSKLFKLPSCNAYNDVLERLGISHKMENDILNYDNNEDTAQTKISSLFFQSFGIVSLAPTIDNILMWSHYAKDSGFCIKFEVSKLPKEWHGPFKIQYKQLIPKKLKPDEMDIIPMILSLQKSKQWKYEKEWRYLINIQNGNRKIPYSLNAIQGIYVGRTFFKDDIWEEGFFPVTIELKQYDSSGKENDCNMQLKKEILDFVCDNHIPFYMDETQELEKINFERYAIKKTNNYGTYQIDIFQNYRQIK